MLFYKQLDSQSIEKLLQSISIYTQNILLQNKTKLSYQQAYDQVYQLCRNQKQQSLLNKLYQTLTKVLPQVFSQLNLQSQNFLTQFAQLIQKTQKNIQIIKDVCLYMDLNYCKRDMGINLIDRLNEIFLSQLFKRKQLLSILGKSLAWQHINERYENISRAIGIIKSIDNQEQFFTNNFVLYYVPIISGHYSKQGQSKFIQFNKSKQIQYYIQYASSRLQKEYKFLSRYWLQSNKKCSNNKVYIMKQLYEILVTRHKQQLYLNHGNKLFNELTLQILQLFKYGIKSQDIQKYADLYNIQIKNKLSTISSQDNDTFIISICNFYKQIMSLLQKTHNKFDIHYRSRFAFQQWINTESLQMPLRLNQFIQHYCLSNNQLPNNNQQNQNSQNKPNNSELSNKNKIFNNQLLNSNTLQQISVIFVLMKQKNAFEKYYRRQLINRIINQHQSYHLSKQSKIVQLMEKQCSEEFVKNTKPIIQAYHNQKSIKSTPNQINPFLINLENWPYDQKNTSVTLNQQFTKLTKKQTQAFNQSNKDKTLYWHPIIGVVKLDIKFMISKWQGQIIVNTCMANILLHFVKTEYKSFELKHFCCQTGYKLDQIYQSVRKLIHVKVLLNQGNEENYKLTINQQFQYSAPVFDILNVQNLNKFEAKPLQQLKADRKFMVQAIIVKIMKKLKHTDKDTILKEAAPLIQKRGFNYNAKFVQNAVERLVDKEFIRDYEDGKFGYIA